jgi:hypothetical protein
MSNSTKYVGFDVSKSKIESIRLATTIETRGYL